MRAQIYFEDIEYFYIFITMLCKWTPWSFVNKKTNPTKKNPTELKAKKPWEITVGVGLQRNRDSEFG